MDELLNSIIAEAQKQGYNSHSLAEKSGVSQPTVYRILERKSKNPDTSTLEKLKVALDISSNNSQMNYFSGQESRLMEIFRKLDDPARASLLMQAEKDLLLIELSNKVKVMEKEDHAGKQESDAVSSGKVAEKSQKVKPLDITSKTGSPC